MDRFVHLTKVNAISFSCVRLRNFVAADIGRYFLEDYVLYVWIYLVSCNIRNLSSKAKTFVFSENCYVVSITAVNFS